MKPVAFGVVTARRFEELLPILEKRGDTPYVKKDLEMRINPFQYMADAKSIIVYLFPYLEGDDMSFARFKRGGDYRPVVKASLRELASSFPFKTKCFVDSGGLVEKHLAYLAGLGIFGRNNLLYNENLGSRFYIGYIICNHELTPNAPISSKCKECNKCIDACPNNALGADFKFNPYECISYLTGRGCDICADVCPMNEGF